MEMVAYGLWGTMAVGVLLTSTVRTCIRFSAWLIPVILLLDFLFLTSKSPIGFLTWKLCFFYGMARWDAVRGMYRLPKWPRMSMRGPGGRRHRDFAEPMPWTRGPGSY